MVETALSSELKTWPADCGDCMLFHLAASAPASRAGECGQGLSEGLGKRPADRQPSLLQAFSGGAVHCFPEGLRVAGGYQGQGGLFLGFTFISLLPLLFVPSRQARAVGAREHWDKCNLVPRALIPLE